MNSVGVLVSIIIIYNKTLKKSKWITDYIWHYFKYKCKNKEHRTNKTYYTDNSKIKRSYVIITEILPSLCEAAEKVRLFPMINI